jgi:hypothetical protein
MDVCEPSALNRTLKKRKKYIKNKSNKDKVIGKAITLTKQPKHKLRSPVSVESEGSSSEDSDSEIASVWADNETLPIKDKQTKPYRTKSAYGNQSGTMAADAHCSRGEIEAARQGAQKPALSARASSESPDLYDIAEDNDFTDITTKIKPTISETAINTALSSSPTPESHAYGSSERKKNKFLTSPR